MSEDTVPSDLEQLLTLTVTGHRTAFAYTIDCHLETSDPMDEKRAFQALLHGVNVLGDWANHIIKQMAVAGGTENS